MSKRRESSERWLNDDDGLTTATVKLESKGKGKTQSWEAVSGFCNWEGKTDLKVKKTRGYQLNFP